MMGEKIAKLKSYSIFEKQESKPVDISYHMVIEYCHSNLLIPISAFYDFWLLIYIRYRWYTSSFFLRLLSNI